jgi:hypothetical protein
MPKFMIPHTIEPHSFDAMWQPGNEAIAQLCFFVGDQDVHYVLVPRVLLQKMGGDIAQLLTEGPSGAVRR